MGGLTAAEAPMDASFRLLGTGCRITSTDARASDRLRSLLSPFAVAHAETAAPHAHLGPGSREGAITLSFQGEHHEGPRPFVLGRLIALLTAMAIDTYPGLAVHAGVVAADGCAVVMAAPSGVGKSTLTAACLRAGFDYLSDEALCVPTGRRDAEPFPKPLAIGGGAASLLGLGRRRLDTKDLWRAEQLGGRRPRTCPVPVGHVVALERSGRGRSVPQPLAASASVATLLGMSFNAHRDRIAALATATAIAQGARAWSLDVGDPHEAAAALHELASTGG